MVSSLAALGACTRSSSTAPSGATATALATTAPLTSTPQTTAKPKPVTRANRATPQATRPAFVYVPSPAPVASVTPHSSGAIAQTSPGATEGGASASPGPHIVSVTATPTVVHDGDTVHWDVRTSPDVVAVSARVATYGFDLQRSGPGHFTLGFAIPNGVPFFFHRSYTLDVIARDRAGETASSTISLAFQ